MDLQEAFDAGFVAVKAYVDGEFSAIEKRLAAIEARTPDKGEKGDQGEAGKDADPELIERMVADAISKIPVPQNGKDGEPGQNGADGKDADSELIERLIAEAVAKLPPPVNGKDGRDGRDGIPGRDGTDGIDGKEGLPGKDGADGVGFDDLKIEYDGERNLSFVFTKGETVKEFAIEIPVPLDRGVWKEGEYKRGDCVTWGGSTWIAQRATSAKPETKDSGWRLAVKRGRDGKDGIDGKGGPQGPEGKQGEPGRDVRWT